MTLLAAEATAQTLTTDLLRGERDGFSGQNRPLRRTTDTDGCRTRGDAPAPSRIGRIPKFEAPAAAGAAATGFDSLNRKKKAAKRKPGVSPTVAPTEIVGGPPVQITPTIAPVAPPPPRLPSAATANRPRLAPSMAGTVAGQPQRRALKVDEDPFGAVGFYRGSMLVKPAIEFWTGYDNNPGRIPNGKGSWLYMVAPELLVASDWQQHSLIADLRGSFTGYSMKNESGVGAAGQHRPAGFHRQGQRTAGHLARHPHQHRDAPAARHRQSGQPEHPGQPAALSADLLVRQLARRRAQLQSLRDRRKHHLRPLRLPGIRR